MHVCMHRYTHEDKSGGHGERLRKLYRSCPLYMRRRQHPQIAQDCNATNKQFPQNTITSNTYAYTHDAYTHDAYIHDAYIQDAYIRAYIHDAYIHDAYICAYFCAYIYAYIHANMPTYIHIYTLT